MVDGDVAGEVATADGRDLTYLEVGDPHGPLVIHNHGGPSSRLEARLLADFGIEESVATHLRGPAGHGTVQSAKGTQLLGLG